jgi:hypothetical protein
MGWKNRKKIGNTISDGRTFSNQQNSPCRMELNLINGGNDLGGLEKGLEVSDTKVGNTDGSGLAGVDELLHLLPGVGELPVLVDNGLVLRVDGVCGKGKLKSCKRKG